MIPVDIISKLYRFNTKELLKLLFDHVSISKNSIVKIDLINLRESLEKVNKDLRVNIEFIQPENGIIKTSYLVQDCDYDVTIKYPYLEYHNSYKNTMVIRPLITEEDFKMFFKTSILLTTEWPEYALKCYTNYSQFNMFMNGKREKFSINQFQSPLKTFKAKKNLIMKAPVQEDSE